MMLSFIKLTLNVKRMQNTYEITLLNDNRTMFVIGKCITFGACDEVKVQKFICLSGIVHVIQYVNL